MKIIIGGVGAVGRHVAKLLSAEHYDIVIIDKDEQRLELLEKKFDLMTLKASPASISALIEAGADKADLFIGVTPDEAVNMTCCMLAHRLGVKRTVARVDNNEYILPENLDFFRNIGINSIIFPEALAAEEIIHGIKRSWVRQWWEVKNSDLVMIGVKLRDNAHILNQAIKDFCTADTPYLIVAIKRENETLIPRGEDMLKESDIVYFMTTQKYVSYIREIAGKTDYPDVKNIIIMGASTTTRQVLRILPDNIHAKVIEIDEEKCEEVIDECEKSGVLLIHGDGRDMELLHEEGIEHTEAFLALTGNAEQNILACLAAKKVGVRKTVAMIESLDYINMAESFDIGTIINKKKIAASHIYQMLLKADVCNVKSLTIAQADVAEFTIEQGARITRKPVKDLHLPSTINLGGLIRNGETMLINGNTQIQPGDHITVFSLKNELFKLEKFLKPH